MKDLLSLLEASALFLLVTVFLFGIPIAIGAVIRWYGADHG